MAVYVHQNGCMQQKLAGFNVLSMPAPWNMFLVLYRSTEDYSEMTSAIIAHILITEVGPRSSTVK